MTVYGGFVRTIPEAFPEAPPARPQIPETPAIPAARPRPPLTKRLGPRQWAALDYVVGGVFGLILLATIRHAVVQVIESPYGVVAYRPLLLAWPLALFLIIMMVVAVGMRRRRPAFMLGILLAGSVVVTALTGPEVGALAYFLPVAYVLYLVAATYEHRQAAVRVLIAVFATLLADGVLLNLTGGGFSPSGAIVWAALCVIIAWFTGYIVRQRRRYAVRLQDEAASKAVAEERLRIARELHDVVAHSMSVIAVQAGYGQYVIDSQPADARTALGAIQATSREALDEMRRMLGALRQADESDAARQDDREIRDERGLRADADAAAPVLAAPLLPAPGLADLDRLVARTARGRRPGGGEPPRDAQGATRQHRHVGLPDRPGVADQRGQARADGLVPGADRLRPRHAGAGGDRQRRRAARDGPRGRRRPGLRFPGRHRRDRARHHRHARAGEPARRGVRAGPLPGYGFQVSAHIPLPRETA